VKRRIPLAFLAPEIVRSICERFQPSTLTAEALQRTARLRWNGPFPRILAVAILPTAPRLMCHRNL
jgi:hypothetical protein